MVEILADHPEDERICAARVLIEELQTIVEFLEGYITYELGPLN